jgi:carbamoyltransferase
VLILGVYTAHDANAALFHDYRLVAAVAEERLTRVKGDGGRFPAEAVAACLREAGASAADVEVLALPRVDYPRKHYRWRAHLPVPQRSRTGQLELASVMARNRVRRPEAAFDAAGWLAAQPVGLRPRRVAFYNHHLSHALGTLFWTDWQDALLYTADGGGDRVFYSARRLTGGALNDLFGGEADTLARRRPQRRADSLGLLYAAATRALGMLPLRHEGKVLGLAAFGTPRFAERLEGCFTVAEDGQIRATAERRTIEALIHDLARTTPREDVAASVQQALERLTLIALERILAGQPTPHLGLSGGVFANVKLTQRIAERFPALREVFVCPAMSDQGEALGGVLQFLLERDGLPAWLAQRPGPAEHLHLGPDHMPEVEAAFHEAGCRVLARSDLPRMAAEMLRAEKVIGTYLGRCEYGPRALGARSIMAAPASRDINAALNRRLDRTDFMPFAPVVQEERAEEVFELPPSLRYTARFMTVTCGVRPQWRDRIPAVVHVDGTARPQLLRREHNPLYHDVLHAHAALTGLPVLINTSFNVHEEPIINRPEEAVRALRQGRVDALLTPGALWTAGPP